MTRLETAVDEAVRLCVAEHGPMDPAAIHAALWPLVRAAAAPYAPRAAAPQPAAARDRRVRRWQYTVRFWNDAGELVGETDPEQMEGTGAVPQILATLAEQLHEFVPPELTPEAVKARLPQLRNNLGRGNHATLRISYADGGGRGHACQMDIHRLEG
jgi:hypothetical protein